MRSCLSARILLGVIIALLATLFVACGDGGKPFRLEKADDHTRRSLTTGPIVGGEGRYGSYAWLGIPYAAPPVGDLRWRDPAPAKPWTEVREALEFGAACPQFTSRLGGLEGPKGTVGGDEDCLTLSVYSPKLNADALPKGDARLPVMVWIHGGGNSTGTTRQYEGGNLAVAQNVLVVTVQYRLGPLGWFRHAALRESSRTATEASGNFGTLDLLLALKWVRDNAAAFGGNPDNVTIFGESAGGRNVYSLLLSPLAKGLFHRAIAESGAPYCTPASEAENLADAPAVGSTRSSAEIVVGLLQKEFKLTREAARARAEKMSRSELAAYLRAKTAVQILETVKPTRNVGLFPQIFDDGAVVPAGCWQNFTKDEGFNRVPVIVGTTRDEARLFLFGDQRFIKLRSGLVPYFVDEKGFLKSADYLTRMMKVAGADSPARAIAERGGQAFVYRFDWDEEPTIMGANLAKMIGAAHGIEIPFIFGHFQMGAMAGRLFTDENEAGRLALSKATMGYWGEFARTGRPGRGTAGAGPEWTPFHPGATHLVLDTPAGGGVRLEKSDESAQKLLADLEQDSALDAQSRCELLQARVYMGWDYTAADYAAREECKPFPYRPRSEL